MTDMRDLELLVRSHNAIIVIETQEETRAVELILRLGSKLPMPVWRWSITDGLGRLDEKLPPQRFNVDPSDVLGHIRSARQPGLYVLLDLHAFLDDPRHVRLLKDIALSHTETRQTLVLLSYRLDLPGELEPYAARFELRLPQQRELAEIVKAEAKHWARANPGQRVRTDETSFRELVRNLAGLTVADAQRLARRVIFADGAISHSDIPRVMQAKYELLNREGVLSFEYETVSFAEVGGLTHFKSWLEARREAFLREPSQSVLDPPKGVLLLGVQGSGKSLAARAVAGVWSVPLLRLDFGTLYNKFHGETERNLRAALHSAQVMEPCVLWVDELEKGIGIDAHDGGTSRRVLGTLLTWMAEARNRVFLVATANDISSLPPELIRKGRLDEIFFVDLPDAQTRREILAIHLRKRSQDPQGFDLEALAQATEGFSGAELEQVVVGALYSAIDRGLDDAQLLNEAYRTQPLSVVMGERVAELREWAAGRTVLAD